MSEKVSDSILTRVYILLGAMGIFALLILFRLVQIQFIQKDKWETISEEGRIYEKKVRAARGDILSANMQVLATSQPFYMLSVDPSLIDPEEFGNFEASLDSLCTLLDEHFTADRYTKDYFYQRIKNKIEKNRNLGEGGRKDRHLYIYPKKVDYQDYKEFKTWPILRNSRFKGGLIGERFNNMRSYPYDSLARITLGRLKNDTTPLRGLEYAFHNELRGEDRVILVQKVGSNVEIPLEDYGDTYAIDGADVITTLDVNMQDVAERALAKGVHDNDAKYGVAILMEVNTGAIKAIANYPENYNRAVATRIAPGSTFKLAAVMAALEDGLVKLEDSIPTGQGWIQYYDATMRDHAGFGTITFQEAFEKSSNVGISKVIFDNYVKKQQVGKFYDHLRRFGLYEKAQSQIVGEPNPLVIDPEHEDYKGTTLPWMSIGYNIQVTPLQILQFYNAVANGGNVVEPRLVSQVRKNTEVVKSFPPRVKRQRICSETVHKQLHEMLKGVVTRGTARSLKPDGYEIAGKTGTVKKLVDGKFTNIYQASFAGYFPAENPRYSLYVLIDEPSAGKIYGGDVAAPIFKEIADEVLLLDKEMYPIYNSEVMGQLFSMGRKPAPRMVDNRSAEQVYMGLEIETPRAQNQAESRWVRAKQKGDGVELTPVELAPGRVPDVIGMSSRDAVALLESLGLRVKLVGRGRVKKTEGLSRGDQIQSSETITLILNQ